MKYDVCVFGGCSLDRMFYQKMDGTYSDEPNMLVPGGKGANQAVAAARAGAKTTIISRVGKDEVGQNIIQNLRFNGVDTSNIEMIEDLNNDTSNIYINIKDKDNDIVRMSGAIDSFTTDMIDKYKDVLNSSHIIVCQLKVPKEVTEKLINYCYDNNKILILTPCRPNKLSIDDENNKKLIDKISIITCNQKECQTIFLNDNVEECVSKYPNKLIVTLGEKGLIYNNGERLVRMPAIDVDKVVDTTGAGDTLNGNLACNLSKGLDLKHSLRKAMYGSAMKIQVKSAQDGMPFKEDLEEFIAVTRNKKFIYNKELNYAIQIVKDAYIRAKSNVNYTIKVKDNNTLVTDVDLDVENYLISKIKEKFGDENFLTEENNPNGKLKDRTWIIDPIDGTSHFIKQSMFWGIQLAFFDKEKVKFSVIYLPKTEELYYAAENEGAFVNNNKILLEGDTPLNEAVVEFGGSLYKNIEDKKVIFNKLVKENKILVANILHINSCCISYTNIVSGKTDALVISSKKPWDILPGSFLCKEAGIKNFSLDFTDNLMLLSRSTEVTDLLLR